MKKYLLLFILSVSVGQLFAQMEHFDLLKFKIPSGWSSHSKLANISYVGTDPENNTPVEIIVYQSQDAAPKIDSSFRMEWRRIFDASYGSPATPAVRKRISSTSLPYAENGTEMTVNNQKQYSHLFVFMIDKKVQSVQVITNKLAAYKSIRLSIDELLESVDTLVKRVE